MKKNYLLLFTVLFTTMSALAVAPAWKSNLKIKKNKPKVTTHTTIGAKKANLLNTTEETLWLPGSATVYATDDAGETWYEMDSWDFTYENNKVIREEALDYATNYAYNENGYWIEQLSQSNDGENWVNSEKKVREYDQIVPDFDTVNQTYYWDEETENWMLGYMHKYVVERNDKQNVDAVYTRTYLIQSGEITNYADISGFRVLYNQNDIATSIINYEYDYDVQSMVAGYTYQDIVWEECGQIMSTDYMCLGDVRAKSYDIAQDGEVLASTNITYNTDGLFSCTKVTTDATVDYKETYTFTNLDNYGSYEESIMYEEEGITYGEKLIERYNKYGEQLEYSYYMVEDGEDILYDQMIFDLTYEGSKLVELLASSINSDSGELEPFEKYVFSNHIADVDNITIDNQTEAVEYYNLQGMRIENPANGIFIRRQGNNVSKVLFK